MGEFAGFGEHRVGYLAQGIKAFDHSIKHHDKVLLAIKMLYVAFTSMFTAELENFCLVEQIYQLSIYRLSYKMCTFVHGYVFCEENKGNQKG